ncbi:O-antigen ligase family protein [Kitasatospora sp. NPDC048365]|uniref:O-antigen ligase family protein n=1 Tax=Kitasatospora sp. NPDC048365 TaxID=3364050 RepID=UPI00371B6356
MRRRPGTAAIRLSTAALWAVGLGPAFFVVVVSDRRPSAPGPLPGWDYPPVEPPAAPWRVEAGQLYLLLTAALLSGVLISRWAGPRRTPDAVGAGLAATGLAMYAGPVLSALFGGHGGADDWRLYLAPLVVAALYAAPAVRPSRMLWRLRAVVRVYTWGSLAALAVAPGWALTSSVIVNFRLPGLGYSRLAGLTDHPILLGTVAAAALVVEAAPLHRSRLWLLHSGAALATLLLAQSRTAWLAAPLALLLLYRRDVPRRLHPLLGRGLIIGTAGCAALLVPALLGGLERVVSDREVTSLHGRTEVWALAMGVFRSHVLLGYGPTLFTDHSSPVRGMYAHAHGQLHQTLATSGLVGALGLVVFVVALVLVAARTARASAGLSWALLVLTLATCVTEAPLRGLEFSPFLLLVLLNVTVLLTMSSSRQPRPAAAVAQAFPGPAGDARSSRSAVNSSEAAGWARTSRSGSCG